VCHHKVSGVPRIFLEIYIHMLWLEKGNILAFIIRIGWGGQKTRTHACAHTYTGSSSTVLSNMCNVLFSYACILIRQGFICDAYLWPLPPFHEAKFCGVPLCVIDKSGWNTVLDQAPFLCFPKNLNSETVCVTDLYGSEPCKV
jgi:hypothetical protein